MMRDGDAAGMDALLLDILGAGYNYRNLMNSNG
jgi:hypothetical protein